MTFGTAFTLRWTEGGPFIRADARIPTLSPMAPAESPFTANERVAPLVPRDRHSVCSSVRQIFGSGRQRIGERRRVRVSRGVGLSEKAFYLQLFALPAAQCERDPLRARTSANARRQRDRAITAATCQLEIRPPSEEYAPSDAACEGCCVATSTGIALK